MLNSTRLTDKYRSMRILIIILLCCIKTFAQNDSITINGKVTDTKSGEPIPFISISLDSIGIKALTNIDGQYILKVPKAILKTGQHFLYFNLTPSLYCNKKIIIEGKDSLIQINYKAEQCYIKMRTPEDDWGVR